MTARRLMPGVIGLVLVAVGVVLLLVGWWRISGESVVALQLPYLASASIPGAALVMAGTVLVVSGRRRATDERIDALVGLLTQAAQVAVDSQGRAVPDVLVTVPGTSHAHRGDCALVLGKNTEAAGPGLTPCPVCRPTS